jgi:hypothetical protein
MFSADSAQASKTPPTESHRFTNCQGRRLQQPQREDPRHLEQPPAACAGGQQQRRRVRRRAGARERHSGGARHGAECGVPLGPRWCVVWVGAQTALVSTAACMIRGQLQQRAAVLATAQPLANTPPTHSRVSADALLAFKAVLTDPASSLASWQPGTNPCGAAHPWDGVTCNADGWVTGVTAEGRGLWGGLAGALANVTRLSEIHMAGNQLTGELCVALSSVCNVMCPLLSLHCSQPTTNGLDPALPLQAPSPASGRSSPCSPPSTCPTTSWPDPCRTPGGPSPTCCGLRRPGTGGWGARCRRRGAAWRLCKCCEFWRGARLCITNAADIYPPPVPDTPNTPTQNKHTNRTATSKATPSKAPSPTAGPPSPPCTLYSWTPTASTAHCPRARCPPACGRWG